jgi:hypothetical protein
MKAQFVTVKFDIEDDPRLRDIYPRDDLLGLWLRLLMQADKAWPKPAYIPRSTNAKKLAVLVAAGCVVLVDDDRYVFHGLDAEHQRRVERATEAATQRWSVSNAGSNAAGMRPASVEHPIGDARKMLARASAPPPPTPISISTSTERGVQGGDDDPVRAYYDATLRAPSGRALAWLAELATDHGEARLCEALRVTDADPPKTYLTRVQVALTTVTIGERAEPGPRSEEEFMAVQAEKRSGASVLDDRALAAIAAHLAGVES